MPLNALELAEFLQSSAQGCKDMSNALADARLRMVPFDYEDPSPYADLLCEKAARVIDFLDELETSLNKLSDELYTEGWE